MSVLERSGFTATGTFHSQPRPGLVPLDVSDAAAVRAAVDRAVPDVVFIAYNSAGGVDWCEDHPDETRDQHVGGARRILEAAAAHRARVVFYSTDYIFDGTAGPYREDAEPSPISVYGRAKREAEALVAAYPHGCADRPDHGGGELGSCVAKFRDDGVERALVRRSAARAERPVVQSDACRVPRRGDRPPGAGRGERGLQHLRQDADDARRFSRSRSRRRWPSIPR